MGERTDAGPESGMGGGIELKLPYGAGLVDDPLDHRAFGHPLRALHPAATSDPSLVELREEISAERRHGLRTGLGRLLEQRGVLRSGLTAERAEDIIYAICGQANY